ncbi:TetR/AcrR family transcriptional regulator [Nocardia sp. NPDC050378]|uniref:TetR/AcrR family transcriptional regulator n=1 Tax=Nocardia sp. NPDC050378 TaxID=3155400 RepID=UPI0033EA6C1A
MTGKAARDRNRRGEGARLREELVGAAARLLEDSGQEALSLRAVAREAGVAPQSVYLQFTDRADLLDAIWVLWFAELTAALSVPENADACARLAAVLRAYCAYGFDHPGRYRVLFSSACAPGWEPDSSNYHGRAAFQVLAEATAAGGADDPMLTATCLWAALHGLVTLRLDRPSFPWPPLNSLLDALLAAHLPTRS